MAVTEVGEKNGCDVCANVVTVTKTDGGIVVRCSADVELIN